MSPVRFRGIRAFVALGGMVLLAVVGGCTTTVPSTPSPAPGLATTSTSAPPATSEHRYYGLGFDAVDGNGVSYSVTCMFGTNNVGFPESQTGEITAKVKEDVERYLVSHPGAKRYSSPGVSDVVEGASFDCYITQAE